MIKVIWSDTAVKDLDHIYAYIAFDSEVYARALIAEILLSVERIEKFPKSGRIVPEIGQENSREIFLGNYRIIYEIKGKAIHILTVIHGARKLK